MVFRRARGSSEVGFLVPLRSGQLVVYCSSLESSLFPDLAQWDRFLPRSAAGSFFPFGAAQIVPFPQAGDGAQCTDRSCLVIVRALVSRQA